MSNRDVMARLADGGRLLMDGGTGSELQRRGLNVAKSSGGTNVGPWSARALGEAPDAVREVHEDYLRVGADIIITNSFYSSRTRLDMDGIGDRWEEYTRLAGELAVQARDNVDPDAFVAGGIAPSRGDSPKIAQEMTEQSEVLAAAGVDLMLPEYVGSIDDCVTAVDACATVGLPVFLGVKMVSRFLADPGPLVQALKGRRVDAILGMCSAPADISATLPGLRAAFDGVVGAYANIGYGSDDADPSNPDKQVRTIEWGENTPERYAEYGREWLDMGAQIVGGCCATGPEHIDALRPVIKGT